MYLPSTIFMDALEQVDQELECSKLALSNAVRVILNFDPASEDNLDKKADETQEKYREQLITELFWVSHYLTVCTALLRHGTIGEAMAEVDVRVESNEFDDNLL
ncbi:hypothetical protein BCD67_24680 [Oscillatoriales cyanobacterium USR001]|nr:hypothetical protein BCD67_24680 [Oscillatoriales cyanobacterium USR001]